MALETPTLIALDPVCGMEVDEQQPGDTDEYEKKIYYFCSIECKDKFAKDPAGYTGLEGGKISFQL
ncbi:MAG: YHS domain-containing protein [Thermodesulfobacteriota bacterium]